MIIEFNLDLIDEDMSKVPPCWELEKHLLDFCNLSITNPEIIARFDKKRNGYKTPLSLNAFIDLNNLFWWRCKKDKHNIQATLEEVLYDKDFCLTCSLVKKAKERRAAQKLNSET